MAGRKLKRIKRRQKGKIPCKCARCNTEKLLFSSVARKFKYCSNLCKWSVNKGKIPGNKVRFSIGQKAVIKCENEFCSHSKMLLPCYARRYKRLYKMHYCSARCRQYVRTEEYRKRKEELLKQKDKNTKRQIWFLR